MDLDVVRARLVAMGFQLRCDVSRACDHVILSSLLPQRPSDEEIARAHQILALIQEIDGESIGRGRADSRAASRDAGLGQWHLSRG